MNGLSYPIVIERSVRTPLRAFLKNRESRFVVLCDANVRTLAEDLTRGRRGCLAVLPFRLGEKQKRLETAEKILAALVQAGADRETLIVGVGGGVASDLFGLCASLYMRGISYVHVATSLVAMVDAAIGGKTGVDLQAGKNLAGTFSDPEAVFVHVDALQTLPFRHVRDGLAEMIKHAIIEGGEVFESLETLAPHAFSRWPWETVIADSIAVKSMVVREDREERGARELLNLGHTFAHAIERSSEYRVSHGAAVSIGLRAAGLLALETGRFSDADHLRVLTLLALLQMPAHTREPMHRMFEAMRTDKKSRNGALRFVVPRAIGDVEYGVSVRDSEVRRVLERITRPPGADEFR